MSLHASLSLNLMQRDKTDMVSNPSFYSLHVLNPAVCVHKSSCRSSFALLSLELRLSVTVRVTSLRLRAEGMKESEPGESKKQGQEGVRKSEKVTILRL